MGLQQGIKFAANGGGGGDGGERRRRWWRAGEAMVESGGGCERRGWGVMGVDDVVAVAIEGAIIVGGEGDEGG